jgi:predicted lipoprotein with Yx(FWY)xxD motif
MKRTLLVALLAVLGGSSLAGGALTPTVKTAKITNLGTVVVNSTGRTLYHYTDESAGRVKCTGACAKLWPPLLLAAGKKPVAGPGIAASKLGVLKRPDGTSQVTYGGLALYRYSGDSKAGVAAGEALEHEWYAVSPSARIVKPSASPASNTGTSGSGTSAPPPMDTTTSGGGGYDMGY